MNRDVLMSIQPEYAEAIFSGAKTVELRRRRPSFAPGSQVVVYSSAPSQHLLGVFLAGEVLADSPGELWKRVCGSAGISQDAYDTYFADCATAYALQVLSPRRLAPRPLRFRPPQSYLFLQKHVAGHRSVLRWATAD